MGLLPMWCLAAIGWPADRSVIFPPPVGSGPITLFSCKARVSIGNCPSSEILFSEQHVQEITQMHCICLFYVVGALRVSLHQRLIYYAVGCIYMSFRIYLIGRTDIKVTVIQHLEFREGNVLSIAFWFTGVYHHVVSSLFASSRSAWVITFAILQGRVGIFFIGNDGQVYFGNFNWLSHWVHLPGGWTSLLFPERRWPSKAHPALYHYFPFGLVNGYFPRYHGSTITFSIQATTVGVFSAISMSIALLPVCGNLMDCCCNLWLLFRICGWKSLQWKDRPWWADLWWWGCSLLPVMGAYHRKFGTRSQGCQ